MTAPPIRPTGVLLSPLADRAVAYDLATETVATVVSALADAGLVGRADDPRPIATTPGSGLAAPASGPGNPPLGADDGAHTDELHGGATGLPTSTDAEQHARSVTVLDATVTLRGPVRLVDDLVEHIGLPPSEGSSQRDVGHTDPRADARTDGGAVIELTPRDFGHVELRPPAVTDDRPLGPPETRRAKTLYERVWSLLNWFAAETETCVAVHAGGVRLPDGRIVLLPAASGSGKSTLTAALVAAGCDLLGDEIIGLDPTTGEAIGYPRRISPSPASRGTLGLEADRPVPEVFDDTDPAELRADVQRLTGHVGPVAAIVSPTFEADALFALESLDVYDGFDQLLRSTMNLARVGQPGLDVLCRVAETVASYRLTHGDAVAAAHALLDPDTFV